MRETSNQGTERERLPDARTPLWGPKDCNLLVCCFFCLGAGFLVVLLVCMFPFKQQLALGLSSMEDKPAHSFLSQ